VTELEARQYALGLVQSSRTLTLSELENYLAAAADLLRGSIDQADFKQYIFPLMFFKRISDVYLEEYAQAIADSDGDHEFAAFVENHRFQIPDAISGRTSAVAHTTSVRPCRRPSGRSRRPIRRRSTAFSGTPPGRTRTSSRTASSPTSSSTSPAAIWRTLPWPRTCSATRTST